MATSRRQPLPCGSQYTASSKSRASSPSIVTSGIARKSSRPCFACSGTSAVSGATSARLSAGHSEAHAAPHSASADEARGGAIQYPDHGPFAAAAAGDAEHAGECAIAVQHGAHLFGREEQVVAAFIGDEKAEAIGVTDDAAADQIHLLSQTVIALAIDDELAVALHGAQAAAQGLEVFLGGEAEGRGDLFERFGPALLGQVFQDEFAAGDGLGVFLRLALVKGVFGRTAFRHDIFLIL